ncbi:LacI family DNA-binding transcriptional regulator [Shewanella aestuarii]|uniref:LacI family DNA-binding transcriptional regulator n=1 Tax=Shewanella aestuarii TaxID=1028752 RepID=A0A6G9QN31_9GAMM|nr:LacI family DNA-binding transcriptional regulator [Shewanella aestuarii]QIR15994.1 LacI family DNA-binding transcriptional regulator [Shewanella aestuarii]
MSNGKTWTLKSIAQELGVSNATVSNAFNRPDQLSEKRRVEILAACNKLGYFGPNKAAQSLRKGKFNTIALVLSDSVAYMVSDPVASRFMKGVAAELEQHKVNLLLFSGSAESVNDVIDFVDGFICYGRPRNSALVGQLKQVKKKVVTVDFNIHRSASVEVDNQTSAYDVAKLAIHSEQDQLAILGLRLLDTSLICRVYDIHQMEIDTSVAHQRLQGYLDAIADSHATLGNDRIWNIPESNVELAAIAAKEALSCNPRPNVFLCMSDLIALTVMSEAQQLGLRVPEDVRIVGFDGIDEALRSVPPLTTVYQHSESKGRKAAEMFMADAHHAEVLDYELIRGGSC